MTKGSAKVKYDSKYLAMQLLKVRLEHGLNKKEAAEKIGINQTSYHFYETEQVSRPSDSFVNKACKAYNKPLEYFARSLNSSDSMIPREIQEWLYKPEAASYVIEAYAKWAAVQHEKETK